MAWNDAAHANRLVPPHPSRCLAFGSAAALLLAAACSAADRLPHRSTTDTLESGVVLVRNEGEGVWDDRSAWRLTDEVRIGARDGLGPMVFGEIRGLALDRWGRVYVLDGHADEVRVFDADGSYVRTIGRRGQGPGELLGPTGIRIDPSGRLWALDPGNQRYSVFDPTGLLVAEYPFRGNVGYVEWDDGVFTPTGDLYDRVPVWFGRRGRKGFARYDTLRGEFVDTVPHPPYPPGTVFPFGRSVPTPRGWWIATRAEYRLTEVAWSGDTIRIVERALEARPFTGEQRDSAARAAREMNRISRGQVDLDVPELRPIFDAMLVDDRDYLWVMLTPDPDADGTVFDVFDRDGVHLGGVGARFRAETSPRPVGRGDRIAFVSEDELDVEYVVVLRIEGRNGAS